MKTYTLRFKDKEYKLRGLTMAAKEHVSDFVRGRELATAKRLLAKELIDGVQYADLKNSILGIEFGTEPVVRFITSEEGKRELIRSMFADPDSISDDLADEIVEASETDVIGVADVLEMAIGDAYPKAMPAVPAVVTTDHTTASE